VLEDGKLRFVLGSPGGSRIITTVTNIFLSAAEGELNIQQAVDAPRFHHQYLPDKLSLENGFPQATQDGLRAMGYELDLGEKHWSNGECIEVDKKTGELEVDRTTAATTAKPLAIRLESRSKMLLRAFHFIKNQVCSFAALMRETGVFCLTCNRHGSAQ